MSLKSIMSTKYLLIYFLKPKVVEVGCLTLIQLYVLMLLTYILYSNYKQKCRMELNGIKASIAVVLIVEFIQNLNY